MNIAIIRGIITKDIELKKTSSGTGAVNFYVAVKRDFKNANNEYESDFVSCKAFGNTAEMISKYFHKGSGIIIEGRIQTGSYEGQDGKRVYTTDVMVSRVHFDRGNEKKEEQKEEAKEVKKYYLSDDPFVEMGEQIKMAEKMPWD